NRPKPTSVGITSSQIRIAFGVARSMPLAGGLSARPPRRMLAWPAIDLGVRQVGSYSPAMAERQTQVACLFPECSRCAFHGSYNLLDWRLATRVRPQLSDVLL